MKIQVNGFRVLAIVAILLGVFVATPMAQGLELEDFFPDNESFIIAARSWQDSNNSEGQEDDIGVVTVQATRSAIEAGVCDISIRVESDALDLVSVRLLRGDDDDSNGVIEGPEWIVVGTGYAVPDGQGGTYATYGASGVYALNNGYRIEQNWTWGTTCDTVSE